MKQTKKKCRCPIPGCNFEYALAKVGWYKHVRSLKNHPYWMPGVAEPDARALAFREQFPTFFPTKIPAPELPDLAPFQAQLDQLRRMLDTTANLLSKPLPSPMFLDGVSFRHPVAD